MDNRGSVSAIRAGVCMGIMFVGVWPACANIDLELRPAHQTVILGETVHVDLYAVSDSPEDQSIAGIDTIIIWSPGVLALQGHVDTGPYDWVLSGFIDDAGLDGVNNTFLDGNAVYTAGRQFNPSPPAFATEEGLLVTTFEFTTLFAGDNFPIAIISALGVHTRSRVIDGFTPGLDVTGTLGSASVSVVVCPPGDFDDSCVADLGDLQGFTDCMSGPGVAIPDPSCDVGDSDNDDDVDLRDYAVFLGFFHVE